MKKLLSVIAMLALLVGFGNLQASASGYVLEGSDYMTVKADATSWGKMHYLKGGNMKIVIPAHKVSGATSRTPRMYIGVYNYNGTSKQRINLFQPYGSQLSKSNTYYVDISKYVDGDNKRAEIKLSYTPNYNSSFTSKIYD